MNGDCGGERSGLIARICNYLQQIHPETASLQELGAHFHISPFHLQRSFKQATGITPHQFAANLRLETSKSKSAMASESLTPSSRSVMVPQAASMNAATKAWA